MFAGDLFYTMALFWSKLSVCLFFRRLSASTIKTTIPDVMTCACAVLGVTAMFIIGLRQQVNRPWMQDSSNSQGTVSDILTIDIRPIVTNEKT